MPYAEYRRPLPARKSVFVRPAETPQRPVVQQDKREEAVRPQEEIRTEKAQEQPAEQEQFNSPEFQAFLNETEPERIQLAKSVELNELAASQDRPEADKEYYRQAAELAKTRLQEYVNLQSERMQSIPGSPNYKSSATAPTSGEVKERLAGIRGTAPKAETTETVMVQDGLADVDLRIQLQNTDPEGLKVYQEKGYDAYVESVNQRNAEAERDYKAAVAENAKIEAENARIVADNITQLMTIPTLDGEVYGQMLANDYRRGVESGDMSTFEKRLKEYNEKVDTTIKLQAEQTKKDIAELRAIPNAGDYLAALYEKAARTGNDDDYSNYKKAVDNYNDIVDSKIKEAEKAQIKFEAENQALPDGSWINKQDLAATKKTQPEVFALLTTKGMTAANKYVEDYNKSIKEPLAVKVSKEGITAKDVWRALTPWVEENKETVVTYMKGYPGRVKETWKYGLQGKQVTQDELKAKFEAQEQAKIDMKAAPLWAKILFPVTTDVFYDKGTKTYHGVVAGEAPFIGSAGKAKEVLKVAEKVAAKAVKAEIAARETASLASKGIAFEAKSASGVLPKPAPGLIRLYRAEDIAGVGKSSPIGQEAMRGEWFTTSKTVAKRYLGYGVNEKELKYVDVPKGILAKTKIDISTLPGGKKWLEGTHLIPRKKITEVAKQASGRADVAAKDAKWALEKKAVAQQEVKWATQRASVATKTIAANDIGMAESTFKEFLKARVANPKLTPETFKATQIAKSVKSKADWERIKDAIKKGEIKSAQDAKNFPVTKRVPTEYTSQSVKPSKLTPVSTSTERLVGGKVASVAAPKAISKIQAVALPSTKFQLSTKKVEATRQRVSTLSESQLSHLTKDQKKAFYINQPLEDVRSQLVKAPVIAPLKKPATLPGVRTVPSPGVSPKKTPAISPAISPAPSPSKSPAPGKSPEISPAKAPAPAPIPVKGIDTAKLPELAKAPAPVPVPAPIPTNVKTPQPAPAPVKPPYPTPIKPPVRPPTPPKPPVRPPIRPPTPPRTPKLPPRLPTLSPGMSDAEKREVIKKAGGAFTWQQGELNGQAVYHVVVYPFRQQDKTTVLGKAPVGAKLVSKGEGESKRSLTLTRGESPETARRFEGGAIDPVVYPISIKKVGIDFVKDVNNRPPSRRFPKPRDKDLGGGIILSRRRGKRIRHLGLY